MDLPTKIAVGSLIVAIVSVCIAAVTVCMSKRLQENQWKRDEMEARRDVLRRLVAYRYRLTESLKGMDGEPFVALNEALVVYAEFPQVMEALTDINNGKGLSRNIVDLVRAMAMAANLSIDNLNDEFIEHPFTPPAD